MVLGPTMRLLLGAALFLAALQPIPSFAQPAKPGADKGKIKEKKEGEVKNNDKAAPPTQEKEKKGTAEEGKTTSDSVDPLLSQPKVQEVIGRIRALNGEALSAFESYSFKKARKKLEEALTLGEEAGISRKAPMAETHLLLAVADVSGSNDLYRGLHDFVAALRLDAKAEIPKSLATPQLLELQGKARLAVKEIRTPPTIRLVQQRTDEESGAGGGQAQLGGTVEGPAKVEGQGLVHEPVDSAKRGLPIPIKAQAGIDIKAQKIILYYRPAGTVAFFKLELVKSGNTFRTTIPAAASAGRFIHYYLEARDARGRLAATKFTARSPTVLIIEP